MNTTIQIDKETHELLTRLRKSMNLDSYNQVIKSIIKEGMSYKGKSLYGALGKKSKDWILKDLRDKSG